MTASDADRAAAHALWNEILCNGGVPGWTATDAIAAALAEARATERAAADQLRTDVEKLVEELERAGADARSAATLLPITDPNRRELAVRALYRTTTAARLRAILDAR
jgi:NAD(P)-dependent dehydrogenase (short-subunit alcohol dehydrogenase family)